MEAFQTFTLEEIEPQIGLVTLNRPDQLNAINVAMLDDFNALFAKLAKDDAIRVLIITGAGRGFCAGADLNDAIVHKDTTAFADPENFLRLVQERYAALILGLRRIPQPVIAAVNGAAAGGGFSMALACDIRVAAPEASFVASFANIGLSGGELGTSYLLPRLIGVARSSEILYTGRKVKADEAERMGLVNQVVPRETLLEAALSYARPMIAKNVGALKLTKRVLDQNIDAPSLEAAVNLENRNQTLMVFSGEFFKLIQPFFKGGAKG
ncbi:MAG: enoyl-CoA hydratase-related protein [Syntrophales bacterium]|jgi:enoyl-CoA hydratase|nr:enoyl-CoA hydratase-related protein [Syntrophales bacterium]MDD4340035.1 enoyl-CoA hydratase-related protein [Syntrophales bacterium]HOG07700.1 enoyl-CoA hydratase-related protein [Syntrophales bacterium]HOS76998.1 enoyl-CoA hydratase-related protein [Syntrophales bacterium]HPB70824.1 enoyl-CoA hydratase-related protein [Syntrophales bacterium]